LQKANVLAVHEDVQEGRDAVARADAVVECRVRIDECVDRAAHRRRLDLHALLAARFLAEHRWDPDLGHAIQDKALTGLTGWRRAQA